MDFLVRARCAGHNARLGLRIDSSHGDADLNPRTAASGNLDRRRDRGDVTESRTDRAKNKERI
ncbi:hypothetical protein [Dankookia sp. P2]|uniref:hypothetical protein n=1 Tax=Dankookia sp. P2 TaxID=3423955 RepID=UPI003D673585